MTTLLKPNDVEQSMFPMYFVCANCGHYHVVDSWVVRCENCGAGAWAHNYSSDGQDVEDFSQKILNFLDSLKP